MPKPNQNLQSFARDLCAEDKVRGHDGELKKVTHPRRRWWVTETSEYTVSLI